MGTEIIDIQKRISNHLESMEEDAAKGCDTCLFEDVPCRFAKNENGCFECTAESDEEMLCRYSM